MSAFMMKTFRHMVTPDTVPCDLLLNSFATKEMSKTMEYLSGIFSSIFNKEDSTLRFVTMEMLKPEEVIAYHKLKNISWEITVSDLYWVKITFEYNGDVIEHYMLYPFSKQGGLMTVADNNRWSIMPLLSDKIISPNNSSIFIRLLRIKMKFSRLNHICMKKEHGAPVAQTLMRSIQETFIYKAESKARVPNNGKPTIIHYLLTTFGFKKTMKKILGHGAKVIHRKDVDKYDNSKYVIYHSTGRKPSNRRLKIATKTTAIHPDYIGSELAIVVPKKSIKDEKLLDSVIVGMFYIIDVLPETTVEDMEDLNYWVYTLGLLSMGAKNDDIIISNIVTHIKSKIQDVDDYMKKRIYEEFKDYLNVDIENDGIFALFIAVVRNFDIWTGMSNVITATAYDKKFDVLYFLYYDITVNINRLHLDLTRKENKKGGIPLERKAVITAISGILNYKVAYGIHKNQTTCSMTDYTSDNYALKITNQIGLQVNTKAMGQAGGKNGSVVDPTTLLDESHVVAGTLSGVSKSHLSPLITPNFYIQVDPKTKTVINSASSKRELSKLADILNKVDGRISVKDLPKEFQTRSQ